MPHHHGKAIADGLRQLLPEHHARRSLLEARVLQHISFGVPRLAGDLPCPRERDLSTRFRLWAGRSTKFLRELGFESIGVDISPEMLSKAREIDPQGDYRLIPSDDMSGLAHESFSLIQSAFAFDNIPGIDTKVHLFRDLRALLKPHGVIVNIVSAPEIYWNEWASFTTKDFPENRNAQPGDPVKIVTTDFEDRSPAVDILWPHESYLEVYGCAGLEISEMRKPLANGDEPCRWVSETRIAPWPIYVLRPSS